MNNPEGECLKEVAMKINQILPRHAGGAGVLTATLVLSVFPVLCVAQVATPPPDIQ